MGSNYVREETDASEREIKATLEFLHPVFLYESWFEMS